MSTNFGRWKAEGRTESDVAEQGKPNLEPKKEMSMRSIKNFFPRLTQKIWGIRSARCWEKWDRDLCEEHADLGDSWAARLLSYSTRAWKYNIYTNCISNGLDSEIPIVVGGRDKTP